MYITGYMYIDIISWLLNVLRVKEKVDNYLHNMVEIRDLLIMFLV